jgi:diphthine synthase
VHRYPGSPAHHLLVSAPRFEAGGQTGSLKFIGLGPFDEKDMSLRALEEARGCGQVFAEFYTAIHGGAPVRNLEAMLGKTITVLKREQVESGDVLLEAARRSDACLLVVGDPFCATTHAELRIRARREGIRTMVVHGASALTAVPGLLGLQHYKFGRTTTLGFPQKGFAPESPYDMIRENLSRGLHTLVLLDIQADAGRLMTAQEGLELLAAIEARRGSGILGNEALVCVVARAGSPEPVIRAGKLGILRFEDFGPPHHSIVVPGKLHFMEAEALVELAGAPPELVKEHEK